MEALPSDVLAYTLSMLDGCSVISILCTSKQVCRLVRSIRSAIHVRSALEDMFLKLPEAEDDCTVPMQCNMEGLEVCGTAYTTEHEILTTMGVSTFRYNRDAFVSIIIPTTLQFVRISLGGHCILTLNSPLLKAFESADGNIDLMVFLKHLPLNPWHNVIIGHQASNDRATLTVTRAPLKYIDYGVLRWRFLHVDEVGDQFYENQYAAKFRLDSQMASLGHIIIVEHEGGQVSDIVQSFHLGVGSRWWEVPGPASLCNRIPPRLFNCPVKLRSCYYLPLWSKVDCSAVPWLELKIVFNRLFHGWIKVYNVRPNSAYAFNCFFGVIFR